MVCANTRFRSFVTTLVLGGCAIVSQAAARLQPADLTSFFVTPDTPATLTWKADGPATSDGLAYDLKDYWGNPVSASGPATRDANGVVHLPVRLKAGFYQITFPATGSEFGVVVAAPHQGQTDPFFGMDSVLSWLEPRPQIREQLIKAMHRTGIAISRDRVSWSHINSAPGKWDFNAVDQYERLRETYARLSVPLLEMFHDCPQWARPNDRTGRFPTDLALTAQSWTRLGGQWRKYWAALEIWNEPEGTYGGNWPAEQYIPTIKTIAYAFQQAGYRTPLGGGVFMGEDPGDFHRTCALNGMLDHVDFVSFHTYHGAADVERHVGRYRQWLKEFGKETMPLWISESGEPWPTGPDRAPQEEDAKSALGITMKAVEAKACGVARYFPFDYPFYEEGPRNFSMMGREGTPLRNMAAYVQCIAALSGKVYVGDLKVGNSVRPARVFGNGNEQVAVLYTGKPAAAQSIAIPPSVTVKAIQGIDGRSLTRNADGSIPNPDGMVYVWGDASAFASFLKTDTTANRLYALSQQPALTRQQHSPIVLQFQRESLPALHRADGYLLQESAAHALSIHVRAWNLSDKAASAKLALQQPGQDQGQPADPVSVPAHGNAEVSWTLDASRSLDIEQYRYLTITDVSGSLPAASPLAIPLMLEGTFEQHLARHPESLRLGIDDLSRWEKNHAQFGQVNLSSPGRGQWRMDLSFSKRTDEWVYPKFPLPKPLDRKRAAGVLVRARAADAGEVRIMLFKKGVATYWTAQPIIPADGKWHAVLVPLGRFDPLADVNNVGSLDLADQEQISVGMHNHSNSNANTLEVSDLLLVGEEATNR